MLESVIKIVKMNIYNESTGEYELRSTPMTVYYPVNEKNASMC